MSHLDAELTVSSPEGETLASIPCVIKKTKFGVWIRLTGGQWELVPWRMEQ